MLDYEEKRKLKKTLYSWGTIVVLSVLILILGKATIGVWGKYKISKENYERVSKTHAELKAREDVLKKEIERITSPLGLEEEVRQKFSVAREGENVAIIVESAGVLSATVVDSKITIWQKIKKWFK